jgi:hypothetical protein
MKTRTAILASIFCVFTLRSAAQTLSDAQLFHALNEQLTEVIVTDGFSPPAAARIYAYTNMAGYEILVPSYPSYISLANQVTDYKGFELKRLANVDEQYLLVLVYTGVAKDFVYRTHLLDHFTQSYIRDRTDLNKVVKEVTEQYAELWKSEFTKWTKGDGYRMVKESERYTSFKGPEFWEPTPPAYLDALEPNWFKLRPLVLDSVTQIRTEPPVAFDTVKTSDFYKEAYEVYESVNDLKPAEREVALFWDCNPVQTQVMGHFNFASRQLNPGGHWLNIIKITCSGPDFPLIRVAQIYAVTSIGLYDGFLLAWHEKYRSSLIRPETYINLYIDSDWSPILETPPFPEHPSAHSVISTTSSVILTKLVGDNVRFTDDSEEPYGLGVREFDSFKQASVEAAYSRMPGGIHYKTGIEAGIVTGKKMGDLIVKRLKTKR